MIKRDAFAAGLVLSATVGGIYVMADDSEYEPLPPAVYSLPSFTTTTIEQPTDTGGLPFAPEGLIGCREMQWYMEQFGLPDHFLEVGMRESSCRNWVTSPTGCCHGYWQIHELHIDAGHLDHCGVEKVSDMKDDTPLSKQKQACAAQAVYIIQGPSAWRDTW